MTDNYIHYVYRITNLINGMQYIGKRSYRGSDINKDKYLGSGTILKQAHKKYGKENFKKDILEICNTEGEAYEREEYYISLYDAVKSDKYYNICGGGKGVGSGESHPRHMLGKTHSEEAKQKMSANHARNMLGKTFSETHKKKISEALIGRYIGVGNPCSKKVVQLDKTTGDFIKVWDSISDIDREWDKIVNTSISAVCKGRGKSAYGYIWRYETDYIKEHPEYKEQLQEILEAV